MKGDRTDRAFVGLFVVLTLAQAGILLAVAMRLLA